MAALGEDLLGIVNKLQDLVFNTIGNDSLDLPQIVRSLLGPFTNYKSLVYWNDTDCSYTGRRRLPIFRKIIRP